MIVDQIRITRKFAFLPKMMYSRIVWFRFYYVEEELRTTQYIPPRGAGMRQHHAWVAVREFIKAKT